MIRFLYWIFGKKEKNNLEKNIIEYEKRRKRIL